MSSNKSPDENMVYIYMYRHVYLKNLKSIESFYPYQKYMVQKYQFTKMPMAGLDVSFVTKKVLSAIHNGHPMTVE